jgi:ankyrin repeat protein
MTDIEERYELPDGMIDLCIELEKQVQNDPEDFEISKTLKREWFNISSKPNSAVHVVDDFIAAVNEGAKGAVESIINCFDSNGNCALHYAVSHGNLGIVQCLIQNAHCDLNVFNHAGYTPVMLAALVDSSEKKDLTPLVKLFKKANLNLHAQKDGQTALMLACSHGRRDTVRLLG